MVSTSNVNAWMIVRGQWAHVQLTQSCTWQNDFGFETQLVSCATTVRTTRDWKGCRQNALKCAVFNVKFPNFKSSAPKPHSGYGAIAPRSDRAPQISIASHVRVLWRHVTLGALSAHAQRGYISVMTSSAMHQPYSEWPQAYFAISYGHFSPSGPTIRRSEPNDPVTQCFSFFGYCCWFGPSSN